MKNYPSLQPFRKRASHKSLSCLKRESERLVALQEANRQSVQLNLLALDSLQQMTEIARCTARTPHISALSQNDLWYQQAEWQ
jgi:hypothetical protein